MEPTHELSKNVGSVEAWKRGRADIVLAVVGCCHTLLPCCDQALRRWRLRQDWLHDFSEEVDASDDDDDDDADESDDIDSGAAFIHGIHDVLKSWTATEPSRRPPPGPSTTLPPFVSYMHMAYPATTAPFVSHAQSFDAPPPFVLDASITSLPRSAQTDERVVRLRLTPRAQPWKAIAEDTQLHGAIDKMGHEVELVASEHEKLETARGRARRERSMRNWTTLGGWVLAYVREVPGASPRAR